MPHQHHFLSRLDRVSWPHVELALSLYRDPDLLRYVLASVRLPEGAERVAVSLEDPTRGPFLVVTRDAKFVTCLAEGMGTDDLPIVTRGQLDGLGARAAELRARLAAARDLTGPKGETHKLLRRLYDAGPALSREEFVAISALEPLMGAKLLALHFDAVLDLETARRVLLKIDRPKPAFFPAFRAYWDTFWAAAHLAVLGMMGGRAVAGALPADTVIFEQPLGWGSVRQGVVAMATRGLWGVAKLGKLQLGAYKRALSGATSAATLLHTLFGLATIGLRHARLAAEAAKAIAAERTFERDEYGDYLVALNSNVAGLLSSGFEGDDELRGAHLEVGRALAVGLGQKYSPGSPNHFDRVEDVPEQLALTLALNHRGDLLNDPAAMVVLAAMVPFLARAAPEELYLPRLHVPLLSAPWSPALTLELLAPIRKHYGKTYATRVDQAPGPTRNGPCPCGSGKKYKRCCAEETA